MIAIPAVIVDGVITASEPIPEGFTYLTFRDMTYFAYYPGDTLPEGQDGSGT